MRYLFNEKAKELPESKPAMLLSAVYAGDEQRVYLKFYDEDNGGIFYWRDRTNHRPYCYTKMEQLQEAEAILKDESKYFGQMVKKQDLILDKEISVLKVIAPDPLSIGGASTSFREKVTSWEADIRYYETYLFDTRLIPGNYYIRHGDALSRYEYPHSTKVQSELQNLLWNKLGTSEEESYKEYIKRWVDLLNQPVPDIKRVAIDIEVETEAGRIPNPVEHNKRITAIGLASNDGLRKVLVLSEKEVELIPEAEICKTEKELISKAFRIISDYPIVITYNGDDFDLPYLYMRSQDPVIAIPREDVPIRLKKEFSRKGIQADPVPIVNGIHVDLFRIFKNRSIQNYAFSHKYTEHTLNAIAEALLGEAKFPFEGYIADLPIETLAKYCMKDAELTYRLTSFNDNLLMKLLIVITRIARLPLDDITRYGVNQWIRGMLYYEHRQKNFLIPTKTELEGKGKASTTALIKEKKYKGAYVMEPKPGIYFNVIFQDFGSLYPSMVKNHNISYETVNCPHDECKNNVIFDTTHWMCRKKKGLTASLIGSLKDLRVNYYKQLAKDDALKEEDKEFYDVISQAIKVIMNAGVGAMGFESFPLYCVPVAEAVTALGRDTILKAIDKAKELGLDVLYTDTDSLAINNPAEADLQKLSQWSRSTLGVDLEVDKTYRYVVFSNLKKNYLGIRPNGKVDIKGLTGKKSHTPPFIKAAFQNILKVLGEVNNIQDFEVAKDKIKQIIRENATNLELGRISPKDLSFNVVINKAIEKYGSVIEQENINEQIVDEEVPLKYKGLPQHIKAALQLRDKGKEVKAGDIISYVKTRDGVQPIQLVKIKDIDISKYHAAMEATFGQVLTSLNFDLKTLLEGSRQTKMDEIFWKMG